MADKPQFDDEDEPTYIRPAGDGAATLKLVSTLDRRGMLWGVLGVLPSLAFLALVAVAKQMRLGTADATVPSWLMTILWIFAVLGPVAGIGGGLVAIRLGSRSRRAMAEAGTPHHAPPGISLGWASLLFGTTNLGIVLWILGQTAVSLR